MKTLLFVCLIALTTIQTADISDFEPIESAFEQTFPIEEVKEAFSCIVEGKDVVVEVIELAENIAEENVLGVVTDAYKIVQNVFKMLNNCKVLFCYEPTFRACEANHAQGCEKNGLVVYPRCADGYTNWGCCVCANECPNDYRDDGLYCAKPGAYGRGAGYVIWDGNKCAAQNPQGCEKYGAIWYPRCKPGYHNVGCCICSPDCPAGWTDIGVSCKKPDTYGRGVGYPVHFGLECLRENHNNRLQSSQVDCQELQEKIGILRALVAGKLEAEEQNIHQSGFSDQIQLLSEAVEQYLNSCSVQQE